ncbi:formylglycine-generating enzyme family protein [Azospirillum griseum]|uniref:Formylglycine-generating enzyme family protein n=1 Tax=Azospirillum griseum TaxID=2496639 RepID=A0A3S0IBZ6_9PROT|nr:formylglycine-generating enzyme family protein [Azospirillum griseum]RTR15695.1 formylglycine-generating enzyme family protein [Azospirillum griseum]
MTSIVKTTIIDKGWHPLADGNPPDWASEWGQDRFGVFVAVTVADVTQRLRWIPPGRFMMGSPDDEPGRYDNEGPQHLVTISRGYWLFDTPCTQALWQAVMGGNPSNFQSPDRPVETVSWNDVQEFLGRTNERIPGLDLTLPTEAQWEHACRAGTATALYSGDIAILGESNAPALDPIAWYGGNSGVGFDLDNGVDSTDWPEKQHPHEKAGTRPVGRKRANPWGLHDTLGNVWEWCADGQRTYTPQPETDPRGPDSADAERVLRGGSWLNYARFARAAWRDQILPDVRGGSIGFRCARVQA